MNDNWQTMKPKFKVGQCVRLTDNGMHNICGLMSWEQVRQANDMIITRIDKGSCCTDKAVHYIEVNQPLINKFMLTTMDIEEI